MTVREIEKGVVQIRGALVASYLLTDGQQAVLIDSGFIGGLRQLETALRKGGLDWPDVIAVLLTHGHLDHTLNLAEIVDRSGAAVYLHPADRPHLEGRYRYTGLARICGALEAVGRWVFRYRAASATIPMENGQRLALLGGIQVLRTPGHTDGHCAFLWEPKNLLFVGDLFACWWARTVLPWPWLNSCPHRFPRSLATVDATSARGLLANHCDCASPKTQMSRFKKWYRRVGCVPLQGDCVV